MKKLLIFIAICAIVLPSCGAKKNVSKQEQQATATETKTETTATLSLEQRVATGEFAWLDTIPIDTSSIPIDIIGHYNLEYYEKAGDNVYPMKATYDSLVFQENGYYKLFKLQELVEYGKYYVSKVDTLNHCYILAFTVPPEKITPVEMEMHNVSILTTFKHTGKAEKYVYSVNYIQYYSIGYKEFTILCNINECYIPGYTQQFWKTY